MSAGRTDPRGVVSSLAVFALLLLAGATRAEDETRAPAAAPWAQIARQARRAVIRVQWRPRGGLGKAVERHAVAVDPQGWLLMAGPPARRDGTLAATLHDGRSMRATVCGVDAETGLTLLHVPVSPLPALPLRPTPARDGQGQPRPLPLRLPAGSPVMLVTAEGAVARGAIRASQRSRLIHDPGLGEQRVVTCLDEAGLATIPSDLGAPWLDAEGRIVGLLVGAEISSPDPSRPPEDGVSLRPDVVAAYAVPAPVLQVVWPLLRAGGNVPRSVLGVRTRPVDDALAAQLVPDGRGCVVTAVAPEGPAARGGVRTGDILRALGGAPLAADARLADVLLPHRPGEAVTLSVLRNGQPHEIEVRLTSAR